MRRYLREGKLTGRRIGQQWFVEERALESNTAQGGIIREAAAPYATLAAGGEVGNNRGSTTRRKMNKAEIEKIIEEITTLREGIKARLGGNLPMTAAQMVRLDREEH